jgi:hypothetical protein
MAFNSYSSPSSRTIGGGGESTVRKMGLECEVQSVKHGIQGGWHEDVEEV